jgi:hypothetical protein
LHLFLDSVCWFPHTHTHTLSLSLSLSLALSLSFAESSSNPEQHHQEQNPNYIFSFSLSILWCSHLIHCSCLVFAITFDANLAKFWATTTTRS